MDRAFAPYAVQSMAQALRMRLTALIPAQSRRDVSLLCNAYT